MVSAEWMQLVSGQSANIAKFDVVPAEHPAPDHRAARTAVAIGQDKVVGDKDQIDRRILGGHAGRAEEPNTHPKYHLAIALKGEPKGRGAKHNLEVAHLNRIVLDHASRAEWTHSGHPPRLGAGEVVAEEGQRVDRRKE